MYKKQYIVYIYIYCKIELEYDFTSIKSVKILLENVSTGMRVSISKGWNLINTSTF